MEKYRLLIIAWSVYIGHVSEFVRNLKRINPQVDISLLTSVSDLEDLPKDILENTATVFRIQHYFGKCRNKLVIGLVNRLLFLIPFIRLSKKKFDIVNIHYPKPRLCFALHWINKTSNHIVISPWGSDVLRVDGERNIKRLRKIYSAAQFVTVKRETMLGKQLIEKFKVDTDKFIGLGWGGEFFDYIQENSVNISTEEAKERFGLNGRYVITCGYNTQREQRHGAIINAIQSVRNQLPENVTLLFPFTYGRTAWSEGYTEGIKKLAKDLGFEVVSIEEELSILDLFKLRMATDIFVHVQTTDAGSRCVMEYVACNKKVVHGSWIKYAYLEDYRPSCYFPVDQLDNLGECIVKAYNTEIGPLPPEVKKVILERTWKQNMTRWNSFFESLICSTV